MPNRKELEFRLLHGYFWGPRGRREEREKKKSQGHNCLYLFVYRFSMVFRSRICFEAWFHIFAISSFTWLHNLLFIICVCQTDDLNIKSWENQTSRRREEIYDIGYIRLISVVWSLLRTYIRIESYFCVLWNCYLNSSAYSMCMFLILFK